MQKIVYILVSLWLVSACSKSNTNSAAPGGGGNTTGKGGSLARFTIVNNYMYAINGSDISVFDISNPQTPVYKNKITIAFDIEALFPFKNKLFIASSTAMYIYNLNNPESPAQESYVQHLTGCDPVVANDSIAFLTIHGGNRCGSSINQLQIYDIKNIAFPQFINSFNLTNPFGLGLQDSVLYVCDNGSGLRVYNVKDPYNLKPMSVITGENVIDVIPMDELLVGMLPNGVVYYDISNPNMIQKLAAIKN